MTGPDHHAEMEAHYAAGMERQDEQHLFDIAFEEAKARVDAEVEREGFPPSAQILVAWGVGAGVRAAASRLMREIGDAREELSRLKIDASNHAYKAESARRERDKAEVEIGRLQFRLEAENARLRKALTDIEAGTVLQFDESEEREVEVWMDPEDMQEIARQVLADPA